MWGKSTAAAFLGLPLAVIVVGICALLSHDQARTTLPWLLVFFLFWIGAMTIAFLFRTGLRAWSWLSSAQMPTTITASGNPRKAAAVDLPHMACLCFGWVVRPAAAQPGVGVRQHDQRRHEPRQRDTHAAPEAIVLHRRRDGAAGQGHRQPAQKIPARQRGRPQGLVRRRQI